ncbi:MAG: hypothetical protein Q8K70_12615 [Bacteroidota bacterium]|nr:hypothetical protein [Bacteroidota bacterium]
MKMVHYLLIFSFLVSIYSCKKEIYSNEQSEARQKVIDDFYNIKIANEVYSFQADGNTGNCRTFLNPEIHKRIITQLNYYRRLVGCSEITLDSLFNEQTQAFLLTSLLNKDSIRIHPGLKCYSQDAANAWGNVISASILNTNQSSPVPHFLSHSGDNSKDLINRIWLLYPRLSRVGYGQLNGVFGIKVTGDGTENTSITTPEYVAWPPKGFVVQEIINSGSRWSFTMMNADFSEVMVNVKTRDLTKAKLKNINKLPMKELEVKIIEKKMNTHLEDRTIFWTIKDIVVDDAYEDEDREYEVTISNVKVGNAYKSYKYTTFVIKKYSFN